MKKILILNVSFAVGGIQTSLQNLLENIHNDYEIDLLILYPDGPLKEKIPDNVTLVEPSWMLNTLGMSLKECLKYGSFKQKIFRFFAGAWAKVVNNRFPIWMAIKNQAVLGPYDVAIAYRHEGMKNEVCSGYINMLNSFVDAKRKIAWIHNDNGTNPLSEEFNDTSYRHIDEIVCVSRSVGESFLKYHPSLREKTTFCYNFVNKKRILEKSMLPQNYNFPPNKFICFSACRLSPEKGIPRAIDAISETLLKNGDVMWIIAGDGVDRRNIEIKIKEYGLEQQIVLIGQIDNPYPYIKSCDVVISTSYFEAAPMLYSEARILHTPVFTTETCSSKEMLNYGEYGIICENSEEGIRNGFSRMINNREVVQTIYHNLEKYQFSVDELKDRFNKIVSG